MRRFQPTCHRKDFIKRLSVLLILLIPFASSFTFRTSQRKPKVHDVTGWLDKISFAKEQDFRSRFQEGHAPAKRDEEYQFGDYTKSFLRYSRTNLLLGIVRAVIAFHLEQYVIQYLPERVLLDIVKLCLEKDTRPKVLRVVATELDRRLSKFRDNYEFGQITRSAVSKFTGKKEYEFGDITRKLLHEARDRTAGSGNSIQKEFDDFNRWRESWQRQK